MNKKILIVIFVIIFAVFVWQMLRPQNSQTISYTCLDNQTAFSSLEKSGHKTEVKDSSFGKMILSIDNISQDNGKYWLYTVNNKEATVSADNYRCQNKENITWNLK